MPLDPSPATDEIMTPQGIMISEGSGTGFLAQDHAFSTPDTFDNTSQNATQSSDQEAAAQGPTREAAAKGTACETAP